MITHPADSEPTGRREHTHEHPHTHSNVWKKVGLRRRRLLLHSLHASIYLVLHTSIFFKNSVLSKTIPSKKQLTLTYSLKKEERSSSYLRIVVTLLPYCLSYHTFEHEEAWRERERMARDFAATEGGSGGGLLLLLLKSSQNLKWRSRATHTLQYIIVIIVVELLQCSY